MKLFEVGAMKNTGTTLHQHLQLDPVLGHFHPLKFTE